jgi:arsenite-transporting ATPase
VPFFDREVVGFSMLKEVGHRLFGEQDPTDMFYKGQVQEITKMAKNYYLAVRLPFVSKDALSVIESGDELIVQAGSYRRNILLPKVLVGLELEEARLNDDLLKIRFKERVRQTKR